MDLTFFAIVILSAWVVVIVAAGLFLALRPGGLAVRLDPVASSSPSAGPRGEIPLGGPAESLGNPRGRIRAALVDPKTRRLLAIRLGNGLEDEDVPASAILDADGQGVHLTDAWADAAPDGIDSKAAIFRDGMQVVNADRKRLGRLRFVCFDPWSQAVTSLVIEERGGGFRLVPFDLVNGAGPEWIDTSVQEQETAKLAAFATDWNIRQGIITAVNGDPGLRSVQRSLDVDVLDQRVRVRGYADDAAQTAQVERLVRAIRGVQQLDLELVTDGDLVASVTNAITRAVPGAQVRVTARAGIVDIAGQAPDRGAAGSMEAAARQVAGVQAVHNMVTVRPATAAAS